MRDTDFVRIERHIAQCRVIMSVAAPFAIYLDPTEPTLLVPLTGGIFILDPYALAVLVLHFVYSVAIFALVTRSRVSLTRIARVSMALDVLFGAAIALVTEGTNSPFYIFFAFAVLAAALRGVRSAIAVTATSVALYLALILISRPEGLGFYVTRGVYLAITGYLVGALGRQRLLLESGFQGLARSLHDGYAQALAGMNLRMETCRELLRRGQSADALTELTELQASVTREYDDLRAYVRSMLGLDTTPAPATSTETRFSIRAQFDAPLPLVEHTLQIMAEGARNVGRHARARMAVITVSPASRKVVIRIDDDGVGFATGAMAPWSIASRAAELGGQVRIGGNESGGHVIVELPRS